MINYKDRDANQAGSNLSSVNNSLTGFTIALAGKGGTGKTTIAASLLKIISERNLGPSLAIDADPNSNLGEVVGIAPKTSVGVIIDSIAKNPSLVPPGMSKNEFIELEIAHALSESANIDLLAMGRPEGPGCYCYANNLLRGIISRIIKQYKFCVIDNEAGMEHLSRRTTRNADFFIVVSDPTPVGMHSGARIRDLVDELEFKFKKIFLIVNKTRGAIKLSEELKRKKFDQILEFGFDEEVYNLSLEGKPITSIKTNSKLIKQTEEFLNNHGVRTN